MVYDTKQAEKTTEKFHHFIAHYVVAAFGYIKMMTLLKNNKGCTVWDFLTVDDLVNSIYIVKNQEDAWSRAYEINKMDRQEQQKYAAYKTLETEEERKKYAPIKTKFKRTTTKREFGKSMVSKEGQFFYQKAKKNWELALDDDKQRKWITKTWYKWVDDTGYAGHWKKHKLSTNGSISEEDQTTQESMEDNAMGEIHLPGDERFDTGLLSTQKGTRLIEPRYNDDMNDNSDNDEIDTNFKSATSEIESGDDNSVKSGDGTEKSSEEDSLVLKRNKTGIEQRQHTTTNTISRANVSKNKEKKQRKR